ncbi:MAG: portal protein [bacterium]
MKTEKQLIVERYKELKERRSLYVPKWKDIQNYVAITNDINSDFEDTQSKGQQKDVFINDPTAFLSTNQAGDYLAGILWNEGIITLEPSAWIKKNSQGEDLSDFFKNASTITQEQVDSSDAGFNAMLKSYCYDQFSFATSGIGAFRNKEFDDEQTECCLSFKSYGVWNSCIDEGNNGKINVIYTIYNWRLNKIVDEFCYTDGEFDDEKLNGLPDELKKAYEANDFNKKFKIVYGVLPNDHYKIGKRGIKGARFKGYWFLESSKDVFQEDYFKELPIAICRAIRVNNQEYGESSGSLALSSIKMLNFVVGDTVDNIDKNTNMSLGIISGSLVNGNVLDTSANSVNQFNAKAVGDSKNPVFPLATVGDISALINFLIPKAEKDIVNVFKIDQLLDFNSGSQMTATESAYRMSIRGKSTAGLISQQKTELLEPLMHRCISIIQDCKLYGNILSEMPEMTEEDIAIKERAIQENDFVPEIVVRAIQEGKRWYSLRFNGELEKLANSELYESLARFLQLAQAVFGIVPETVMAMKGYELLKLIKDISNLNNDKLMLGEKEYKDVVAAAQQAQAKERETQNLLAQSQIGKNVASAGKEEATANETQSKSNGLN